MNKLNFIRNELWKKCIGCIKKDCFLLVNKKIKIMYWNEHTTYKNIKIDEILMKNFNGKILSDVLWMDEN